MQARSTNDIAIAPIAGDARAFAPFVFAQRRPVLDNLESPWLAVGAWRRGVPVGLALCHMGAAHPWLESIMVAAPFRKRGIGGALLDRFVAELQTRGAARIEAQYSGEMATRASFEGLVASRGWAAPEIVDIQLVGLAGTMADGGGAWRGVQRAMRELVDHSVEPFALNGADDDAAIDTILATRPTYKVNDPRGTINFDPDVSTVLRERGKLVGWIIAQRLDSSRGRGTFVPGAVSLMYPGARLADGQHPATMLLGYHRAFSRQAELYGPDSRAVYRTHPGAPAMFAFTRARFAPMALHVEDRLGTSFDLTNSTGSHQPLMEYATC